MYTINKLLLIALILSPLNANAKCNDVVELSRILYAESESQSIEGITALGESAINRSKRTKLSLCKIHGVNRKEPNKILKSKWESVARSILNDSRKSKSIVGNADSWVKGKVPSMPGRITRHIGAHTFYIMDGELK